MDSDSECYATGLGYIYTPTVRTGQAVLLSVTLTLSVCVPDPILSFSADWGRKSLNLDCDSAEQVRMRKK